MRGGALRMKIENPGIAARVPLTLRNAQLLLHCDGNGLAGVTGGAKGKDDWLRTRV
jgi:hypothetical protein